MKALVIGGAGFVGKHLIEFLCSQKGLEVYATKLLSENIEAIGINQEYIYNLDVTNKSQVLEVIQMVMPDYIFHLAAQSSVLLSWKEPTLTYNINVIGTINVLEVIRLLNLQTRILLIGSAEQYGAIREEDLPIKEELEIKPTNPYAVTKASQEMVAKMYVKAYGMSIIMVRAFNHIGPGQGSMFVISDFAKQIAEIDKGIREPIIFVGNLNAKRDFTDVRDIVRGYWMLVQKGKIGEVYNIGSGKSYEIRQILDMLICLSNNRINVIVDEKKLRPIDIGELRSDINKIRKDTEWQPEIELCKTLEDVIEYWRSIV